MHRQKIFALFIFAALLAACSSTNQTPASVPATISAAGGPYDGRWEGMGKTSDGQNLSIAFMVSDSVIQSFTYSYVSGEGLACSGIAHDDIPPASRPQLRNGSFAFALPPDLTVNGRFNSDISASGQISVIQLEGARRRHCAVSLTAEWTALKQKEVQVGPVTTGWCGIKVNCRDLLFQLLIFGLVNGAILALNAIGITVIYSTVRTLNLAHGDVFALTSALVTSTINIIGLNLDWAAGTRVLVLAGVLIAAILCGALLSVGVEEAAFRPFRGRSRLAPVIASLGISFILYQAALLWRTYQKSFIRGEHRSVPGLPEVPTDGIPNFFPLGNLLHGKVVLQFSDVFVFIAAVFFVLVATYVLSRTRLGRSIRAVVQNEELAQIVGVDRDRAIRRAFALGGALAGVAAFIFAMYYTRPFGQAGAQSGLFAFAAALLGGVGSPFGALLSGLLLGMVGSFSDYFISAQWTPVLILGLLTVLLVWRRGGFAGESVTEDQSARDSIVLTASIQNPRARRLLIALMITLAALPLGSSVFHLGGEALLRGLGIFVLLTLGLNILLGLAGVLDLGYAMSFAIGGYSAALLTNRFGVLHMNPPLDFTLVLLLSAGLAGLFGVLKGMTATRLHGDYLAVATLALGLITRQIIVNASNVTGGPGGISGLPPPHLFGFVLSASSAQYYLVFGIVFLAALASGRLMGSRTGRAWLASSEDETAAISFGVDASRYRHLAFIISSVLAGIAGALYASTFGYIDPDIAAFHISAMMLAMVILGGAGSVSGAILGTLLIYGYDKVIIPQLAALLAFLWPQGVYIGMVPDIRGTNFFNFGIALYLTVLWRASRRK
jgi:branched-chain amino acid transport system permease protein